MEQEKSRKEKKEKCNYGLMRPHFFFSLKYKSIITLFFSIKFSLFSKNPLTHTHTFQINHSSLTFISINFRLFSFLFFYFDLNDFFRLFLVLKNTKKYALIIIKKVDIYYINIIINNFSTIKIVRGRLSVKECGVVWCWLYGCI